MHVSPMNLSGLTKLCYVKPGELVQPYDAILQPVGYYITSATQGHLFDPVSGSYKDFHTSTRCKIYKGAQIVTDFIEGA